MEKEKIERVKAYLEREYGRNVNLLAALQSGIAKIAHMEEEGCLLCVAEDIWQLCAETEACAERLLQQVPEHAALLAEKQQTVQLTEAGTDVDIFRAGRDLLVMVHGNKHRFLDTALFQCGEQMCIQFGFQIAVGNLQDTHSQSPQ